MADKNLIEFTLGIANPQVLADLKSLSNNQINLRINTNLDPKFTQLLNLTSQNISVAVNADNAFRVLRQLEQQFLKLQDLQTINIPTTTVGGRPRTPDAIERNFITEQIRALGGDPGNTIGATTQSLRDQRDALDLQASEQRAVESFQVAHGIAKRQQLDYETNPFNKERFRFDRASEELNRNAILRATVGQQRAAVQIGSANGLDENQIQQLAGKKFGTFDFQGRVLQDKNALVQLGFAGLFGGIPSLIGAGIGGALGGAEGTFLGSTVAQGAVRGLEEITHKIIGHVESLIKAGIGFEEAITGISAILQASTKLTGPGGRELSVAEQIQFQTKQAREIQLAARSQLVPLGIAGQTEATLVRAVTQGAAERGINLSAKGTATLAARFGALAQAVNPALLENSSLLTRNIEDILGGLPSAQRTALGVAVRPELAQLKTAKSEEDLLKATTRLDAFIQAIRNSDQGSVALIRLSGAIDQLKTVAGDAILQAIVPGLNKLSETLSDPAFVKGATLFSTTLGSIISAMGEAVAFFLKNNFGDANKIKETLKVSGQAAAGAGGALGGAVLGGALGGLLGPLGIVPGTIIGAGIGTTIGYSLDPFGGFSNEFDRQQEEQDQAELIKQKVQQNRNLRIKNGIANLEDFTTLSQPSAATEANQLIKEADEIKRKTTLEQTTISTRLPEGKITSATLNIQALTEEIDKIQEASQLATGAIKEENQVRLKALETAKHEEGIKRELAQIDQVRLQLDENSIAGKQQAVELNRRTNVLGGVPEDLARQKAQAEQQNNLIGTFDVFKRVTTAAENLRDVVFDSANKFRELNRGLEESKQSLEKFKASAELREFGRQGQELDIAKQILEAGGSRTDILRAGLGEVADLAEDPEKERKFKLDRLIKQGQVDTSIFGGGLNRFNAQDQEARDQGRLEDKIASAEDELVNRLPRALRDSTEALGKSLVELSQKIKGTDLDLSPLGEAINSFAVKFLGGLQGQLPVGATSVTRPIGYSATPEVLTQAELSLIGDYRNSTGEFQGSGLNSFTRQDFLPIGEDDGHISAEALSKLDTRTKAREAVDPFNYKTPPISEKNLKYLDPNETESIKDYPFLGNPFTPTPLTIPGFGPEKQFGTGSNIFNELDPGQFKIGIADGISKVFDSTGSNGFASSGLGLRTLPSLGSGFVGDLNKPLGYENPNADFDATGIDFDPFNPAPIKPLSFRSSGLPSLLPQGVTGFSSLLGAAGGDSNGTKTTPVQSIVRLDDEQLNRLIASITGAIKQGINGAFVGP